MIRMTAEEFRQKFGEKKQSKYRNEKTEVDGIIFDSRKEAQRYLELRQMERAGIISNLHRQYPFLLIPKQLSKSGEVIRETKYIADFVYIKDGDIVVEDTKSKATKTPEYRLKRKLMLERHGIEIQEV